MGYSHYHFPDSRNDSVMATGGFSRDLSEIWSILVNVGVRRTWSEVFVTELVPFGPSALIAVRERLKNDDWGAVAGVSLNYTKLYGRIL